MPRDFAIFSDPDVDLLLMTYSLIALTKGEKRRRLRQVWINSSRRVATEALGLDVSLLPLSPSNAVLALFKATLDLADVCGVPRVELVEHFNLRGESGAVAKPEALDGAIADCFAFVMALASARQLQLAKDDETAAAKEQRA